MSKRAEAPETLEAGTKQMDGGDNDEAEPSSMVDSVLSGGSSKTSAPSYCLGCFAPQFAKVCLSCPRTNSESRTNSPSPPPLSIATTETMLQSSTTPNLCYAQSIQEPISEVEETFEEFLAGLTGDFLVSPLDVLDILEVTEPDDDDEINPQERVGRKSAEDGKHAAFQSPFMDALYAIGQPCNQLCPLSGFCTRSISAKTIFDLRQKYFLAAGMPAPKDKERAEIIMDYLRKAKKDKDNNLIFVVDNQDVCTPAFLRLLGVTTSVDMSKTPGQWQRLIKGFLSKDSSDYLLSEEELKADAKIEFTEKRGHATAFINDIAAYFSDSIPAATTEDGETKTMVVPYRHVKDLFREYVFHCDASGIGKEKRASYPTFVRACNVLREDKVIKFLGGKSGFQTCAICNRTLSIKQSACCKRDTVTRDALLKVHSLHLAQQSTERQFAENFSKESEKIEDGQPVQAHIDFDGQSTWVGNTPKYCKDRTSATDNVIENRNIGVRIVCGPVKEYISVCTNNLIPHGANVLLEVLKYSIEYLAKRLMDFGMVLPKKLGVQGDNSGENKNKEMFCFLSHMVEDCYFDEIELFFLIVGHTHNILDQWFGVLSRAIRGASFIGSYLAMHELYKIAHQDDEADLRPQDVHQLELYHDWRRFYNAVRNDEIHHIGIPHRFKITLDQQLKVAKMQYMVMSPPHGFRHLEKWQPVPTQADLITGNINGSIPLTPLVVFNGPEVVLKALGASGKTSFTDIAVGDKKTGDKAVDLSYIVPVLRQIEAQAIGETAIRLEQEAERGESDEKIHLSAAQITKLYSEISNTNSSKGGRIVWLRRSKIADDPEYLNRRPDILPNPKLWNERIANEPKLPPPEESFSGASRPPKLTSAEIAKNKKDSADAAESKQRLISFQKHASEIALTATSILKLLDTPGSGLSVSNHNNIVSATKNFSKSVLTPREEAWYRSVSSARSITTKVEALVEDAMKKPWSLLNLPIETTEQKAHREALLIARKARLAHIEASLRKLLMRDGEGEYNPDLQVVSMDGFKPAQSQDIDKMNRPQLEALAKGHMKTVEIKKLKVDQLRAAVKRLAEKFPDLLQIPGAPSSQHITEQSVDIVVNSENGASVTSLMELANEDRRTTTCSVLECDSANSTLTVLCEECDLHFCTDLHALHSSHSKQYLLPDRVRKPHDLEVHDTSVTEQQVLAETICAAVLSSNSEAEAALLAIGKSPKKRQSADMISASPKRLTTVVEVAPTLELSIRSIDDNPESRHSWELDKLKDAVSFIRQELSDRKIDKKTTLSREFEIDISHLLSKKRVLLKDVLTYIINNLVK